MIQRLDRLNGILLTAALALAAPLCVDRAEAAEPTAEAEVDHVALATRLVRDGHFDRAERVLEAVDVDRPGVDLADLYTLRGLIALNARRWEDAAQHLDDAIRHGKTDDVVFVYLAQAYYGMQDWRRTVQAVRGADAEADALPTLGLMQAQAHWRLGELEAAWAVLSEGAESFPDRPDFDRQRIALLVELGLYREAVDLGTRFVAREGASADDYLALGEALRRSRQLDEAKRFLEQARLLYPDDPRIVVQLAHAYVDAEMPLAAAELFGRAAALDPSFVIESAELYRRAGAFERALYANAQIADQPRKLRQRVAILLDQQRFEAVAAMAPRLARLGLLEDQAMRYALAYAHFQTGDHAGSERLLKGIHDPELFENATQLREVMARCQATPEAC